MPYILAVDDDPEVLETLGRVLERENFEVELSSSSAQALRMIDERKPDLLILDIVMPSPDGITVCRGLRGDLRYISLPILFLTAKGSTDDVVDGLDAGADDYVVKPFELVELQARIHALLRRSQREEPGGAILQIGDLKLDTGSYKLYINDSDAQLTSTEYRLLRYMMENSSKALSPGHLLQTVWEYPAGTGDPDLVRAHVRNLRAKIGKVADHNYIRTIHGIGYMISA